MSTVGFSTPLTLPRSRGPWASWMTAAESYFYLGGKKAYVYGQKTGEGHWEANIREEQLTRWQLAQKIALYSLSVLAAGLLLTQAVETVAFFAVLYTVVELPLLYLICKA